MRETPLPATFAQLLRQARRAAGLTQEALAERTGLGTRTIQGLERGTNQPRRETLDRLMSGLALSAEERRAFVQATQPAPRLRPNLSGSPPRHDSSPTTVFQAHPTNLPLELTSFVGRKEEIREISLLLTARRLVTLTGAGGCGKTRLALQIAANLVEDYPDGVWLVELAPLADPRLAPQAVASVLRVPEAVGQDLVSVVVEALRPRSLLLLLDNCEHLLDACAQLADAVLPSCPKVQILATSREMLGVRGEMIWQVPTLMVPDVATTTFEGVRQSEAVQLFVDRARAVVPDFAATVENAPALAQVCQQLDGIPLAIELAAARVRVLSVDQIAARLDDRFHLLTGGSRTALRRQQTLRATVDWSHDLLSEKERTLLRRLAVFTGGWTLETAEAVCSDGEPMRAMDAAVDSHKSLIAVEEVLDLLTALVDKSLVVVEQTSGDRRYHFLETIRVYAAEKLAQANETQAVRERHLASYLSLAERAEPELLGARQVAWYATLQAEWANVRAALEWGFDNTCDAAPRLAAAIWWFWHTSSEQSEGIRLLETALSRVSVPSLTRAKLLLGLVFLTRKPHDGQVRALMDENLSLFRELGDPVGSAWALHNLGIVNELEGDHVAATRLLEESIALFEAAGDRAGAGASLRDLGQFVALQGSDRERGWELLEKSRVVLEGVGDCWNQGWTLRHLGYLARLKGDNERAMALSEESLQLFRSIGDLYGTNQVLLDLVNLVGLGSDVGHAQEILASSLSRMRHVGNTFAIAQSICAFGIFAIRHGESQRGVRLIAAAAAEHTLTATYANQRADVEAGLAAARTTMGDEAFAEAWAEGQAMTLKQAAAYALEEDGR